MTKLPWEINADLTRDRIIEVGLLLAEVRGEVIDRHDVSLGDTRLSLGMRAYECCRTRIISQVDQYTWPWLFVLTKEGRFTFQIGDTPVRFVRNEPENLPSDKLIPSEETLVQMNLFADDIPYAEIRWFYVIDTYYKSPADNMYFVGYDEHGIIVCKWDIPLEKKTALLAEVENQQSKAVEIDKAPIKLKKVKEKVLASNE
ncbi:hypothetical protein [Kiloniella sp.]|uniref:hypothetical protein n=1 Tax=Kiloniella sp. TaxID=1938587 RepID=UPI003A959301